MERTNKKSKSPEKSQSKTLFDHITQIRYLKTSDYVETLTENDLKTFNQYMICRFLSMDPDAIHQVNYLASVLNKFDNKTFYKLACSLIPKKKNVEFIKKNSIQYSEVLIKYVCDKYQVSSREANDYCDILFLTDLGKKELYDICVGHGLEDKQINKILTSHEQ